MALTWLAQVETLEPFEATESSVAAEGLPLGGITQIGMELFGPFALPFEMASLILLAAIVGAVVLARRRT